MNTQADEVVELKLNRDLQDLQYHNKRSGEKDK